MNGLVLRNMLWHIDPQGAYEPAGDQSVIEACGLIPHFLDGTDARTPREQFEIHYRFGVHANTGGTVTDDGTYTYPQDPPLAPYMSTSLGDYKVYIYPYGMVSIVHRETGDQFHTRLD